MSRQLSVIIINYGKPDLLVNFLKSARDSADLNLIKEIIIVDNGYPLRGDSRHVISTSSFPFGIKFVQNPESSYASGVNRGAAIASGEYLIISNNDVELLPDSSFKPLVDYLEKDSHIGVVGPQLVYPDGSWQRSYGRFPSLREACISLTMLDSLWHGTIAWAFSHNLVVGRCNPVDYIDGAFMMIRRSCFEGLGGFSEDYSFYSEDADFCWRARRKGWKVVFCPEVRVTHVRGASSTMNALENYTVRLFQAKLKFVREHYGLNQARWYGRISALALWERTMLYGLVAKIIRLPQWRNRAMQARACYKAIIRIKEAQ